MITPYTEKIRYRAFKVSFLLFYRCHLETSHSVSLKKFLSVQMRTVHPESL